MLQAFPSFLWSEGSSMSSEVSGDNTRITLMCGSRKIFPEASAQPWELWNVNNPKPCCSAWESVIVSCSQVIQLPPNGYLGGQWVKMMEVFSILWVRVTSSGSVDSPQHPHRKSHMSLLRGKEVFLCKINVMKACFFFVVVVFVRVAHVFFSLMLYQHNCNE